jgi:outer membrane protein assembly factor BamB
VSARQFRTVVALLVAVAATWFVARPAFGAAEHPRPHVSRPDAVAWRATLRDGPTDLAADADGVAVTTSAQSVYLLDADGHVRWRAPSDGLALGQPALGPDVVVVGGMSSVTVFSRADGSRRWALPRAGVTNSLAVVGDSVLVGDDSGTLAALSADSGAERWSVRYPGALWSGARVDPAAGAVVATWHQSESPAVRVLDLATGALRWEAPTARFTAAPSVHRGRVVLAIGDGDRHARVEARDLATGALQWQTPVPASFEAAIEPAVDDHAVAVVDHFGVVTVLDPDTGRLRWQHDLADVLLATRVVLTGSRVAFTSYAGVLHVLDRHDGHVVQTVAARRLGGLPTAIATVPQGRGGPGGRGGAVLLALRLQDWGVQLRRLA